MLRGLAVSLAVLALPAPAAAQAAPFGELPFVPLHGPAVCVRATGVPGEVVRWTRSGMQLLQARREGFVPAGQVALGRLLTCPAVAADPSGAAVLAGLTADGLRVAVREPSGAWGTPVTVPGNASDSIEAAISPRGDVVVAWIEYTGDRAAVRAVVRPAGGSFGAVQRIARSGGALFGSASVSAGMTGGGEALLAVTVTSTSSRSVSGRIAVWSAPPDRPFGAPRTLTRESFGGSATLAVAPDGRALVAATSFGSLVVFERPPGGEFGPAQAVESREVDAAPALSVRDGGAAVLAWTENNALHTLVRDGPMPFGQPAPSSDVQPVSGGGSVSEILVGSRKAGPIVPVDVGSPMRVLLGAGGRAFVVRPTAAGGIRASTVSSRGPLEDARLGSPLRDAAGISPLVLADGTRAVAWSDDNRNVLVPGPFDGRLHLAVEGASTGPDGPPPQVTALAPRRRALRPAQSLVLPVRCSAACDVRAALPGPESVLATTGSLAGPGRLELRFRPIFRAIAPKRGPLKLDLRYGAPGAHAPQRKTVSVRLHRLPAPPVPHIEHLRVRRIGDDLDVRWTTDVPAQDASFAVYGSTKPRPGEEVGAATAVEGDGRRSFRVRLKDARRARYVHVFVYGVLGSGRDIETVRVPG